MVEVLRIRADLVARAFQRLFLSIFKRPFQAHLLIKLLIIKVFGYIGYIHLRIWVLADHWVYNLFARCQLEASWQGYIQMIYTTVLYGSTSTMMYELQLQNCTANGVLSCDQCGPWNQIRTATKLV